MGKSRDRNLAFPAQAKYAILYFRRLQQRSFAQNLSSKFHVRQKLAKETCLENSPRKLARKTHFVRRTKNLLGKLAKKTNYEYRSFTSNSGAGTTLLWLTKI